MGGHQSWRADRTARRCRCAGSAPGERRASRPGKAIKLGAAVGRLGDRACRSVPDITKWTVFRDFSRTPTVERFDEAKTIEPNCSNGSAAANYSNTAPPHITHLFKGTVNRLPQITIVAVASQLFFQRWVLLRNRLAFLFGEYGPHKFHIYVCSRVRDYRLDYAIRFYARRGFFEVQRGSSQGVDNNARVVFGIDVVILFLTAAMFAPKQAVPKFSIVLYDELRGQTAFFSVAALMQITAGYLWLRLDNIYVSRCWLRSVSNRLRYILVGKGCRVQSNIFEPPL